MAIAEMPLRDRELSAPARVVAEPSAVLVLACDGYGKGTTGSVTGERQGCLVFVPDDPSTVARWTHPRRELLVPASFVAALP